MSISNPSLEVRCRDTEALLGWLVFVDEIIEPTYFSLVCDRFYPVPCQVTRTVGAGGVGSHLSVLVNAEDLPTLRRCNEFTEFCKPGTPVDESAERRGAELVG